MKFGRVFSIFFIIVMASGLLPLSIRQIEGASAQAGINGDSIFQGEISSRGAFHYADNSSVQWDDNGDGKSEAHILEAPLIVNLASNGMIPGDQVMISWYGEIHVASNASYATIAKPPTVLACVFSSSDTLLWDNSRDGEVGPLNRVSGAVDYPDRDYVTSKTQNQYSTDIPEDFLVGEFIGSWIKVPNGAVYLFLAMYDQQYCDNDGKIKVTIEKDTDGDGLPNLWEKNGADFNKDNAPDFTLAGADWKKKDIFVEVDYMQGHRFSAVASNQVITAFQNAPDPINLHVEVDDADNIFHQDSIRVDAYTGYWPDFDDLKSDHFGTPTQRDNTNVLKAKNMAYHYCLMIHDWAKFNGTSSKWEDTGSSGIAEPYGNDFIVSLGTFTGGVGTVEEQAGTFMHELGHNLGLQHGGNDNINYKPNYLSVMNYFFQTPAKQFTRPLDYSRATQPTLDEKDLDEPDGIGAVAYWPTTVFSAPIWNTTGEYWRYIPLPVSTLGAIDWNNNGDDTETSVRANLNYFPQEGWEYFSPLDEPLKGYDDWSNLHFRFQDTRDFADGVHSSEFGVNELTWDTIEAMRESFGQLHEVAVINVAPSQAVWQQGVALWVNVTLANYGGFDENVTVTVYANSTIVAFYSLVSKVGNLTSVVLPYSGQALTPGTYTLKAVVSPVAQEIYTADNIAIGTVITVTDVIPEFPHVLMLTALITVTLAVSLGFRRKNKS
jgi:hypothetical protein